MSALTAEPTVTGFAPDSIYAEWSVGEREASDRMEAVYNHERHLEAHERFGPHTKHWLRFQPDDSLRRSAVRLVREIEDIEAGDLPDAKGKRLRLAQARLRDVNAEREFRQVLAETWQASEQGTHSITGYHARGGLGAVLHHKATPPSYALAVMLDHLNSLRGEPTVLDWSKPEPWAPVSLREGRVMLGFGKTKVEKHAAKVARRKGRAS